jgi:hypothetical protein
VRDEGDECADGGKRKNLNHIISEHTLSKLVRVAYEYHIKTTNSSLTVKSMIHARYPTLRYKAHNAE